MKKLIITLFSLLIAFNSFGGWFDKTICVGISAQDRDGVIYLLKSSKPFSGNNLCKYENGQDKSQGALKEGKKIDIWTKWYQNGMVSEEANYKEEGIVSSTRYQYYSDGQKKSEENYKDDKYDGKVTYWSEEGQIETERDYKNGLEIGQAGSIITRYLNDQIKSEESYKNNKKDGRFNFFHNNGQIKLKENYVKGEKISHTLYKYYEKDKKYYEINYKNNELSGEWTKWHENGNLQSKGSYKDNKKNGVWTIWNENGLIQIKENYKKGNLVAQTQYMYNSIGPVSYTHLTLPTIYSV